jgi:hypothetical protein
MQPFNDLSTSQNRAIIMHKLFVSGQRTEGITKPAMSNNHIQLNGNVYNARTGILLKKSAQPTHKRPVDGFVRPQRVSRMSLPDESTPRQAQIPQQTKPKKSQTLMRNAVKKPEILLPHADEIVRNSHKPLLKRQPRITNQSRLERANAIGLSSKVKRFGFVNQGTNNPSETAPEQTPNNGQNRSQTKPDQTTQQLRSSAPQTMLERAVAEADSHTQDPIPRDSLIARMANKLRIQPRSLSFGLSGLGAIIVLGVAIQFALPHTAMMIANSRAGIDANLPQYKPSGFALSSTVEYKPGHVAVEYNSRTDERAYRLSQTKTDWNSETLRTNFVEQQGLYQTVPHRGKTIYIYNGSNATWIDGGIWHTIEGSSELSSEQLLKIANSL